MKEKIPKNADNAIELLEKLVTQLHYFYNGDELKFKKNVLKDAVEIENTLKELAINKKDTFKRIANKYESYYKRKQEAIDNTVINTDDTKLNESIRDRYRHDVKKDRT